MGTTRKVLDHDTMFAVNTSYVWLLIVNWRGTLATIGVRKVCSGEYKYRSYHFICKTKSLKKELKLKPGVRTKFGRYFKIKQIKINKVIETITVLRMKR